MENDSYKTNPSLIERIKQESDAKGWERFFDIYSPLLLRYSYSLGLNYGEAEDLVQETVISVSKTIKNFQYDPSKCSFKSWLFMIVKRRLIDLRRAQWCRMHQKHYSLNKETLDNQELPIEDKDQASPDQQLWEKEFEEFIRERVFNLLKKKFKIEYLQIFDLAINKEWSTPEIAKYLQISKPRIYLILHRMRKVLNKERNSILHGDI